VALEKLNRFSGLNWLAVRIPTCTARVRFPPAPPTLSLCLGGSTCQITTFADPQSRTYFQSTDWTQEGSLALPSHFRGWMPNGQAQSPENDCYAGSNPVHPSKDQSVFVAFDFAHRAWTALRALSLRSSGVILAARAAPPFLPPFRPSATAAGFFRFAMPIVYVSGYEIVNAFLVD
jgi:hypothetical protein